MKLLALLLMAVGTLAAADRRAPGFALPDSNLKYHDLYDSRGKVTLIEFMRTDCPKCQALTKNLSEVHAKYGANVEIIYVVNPPDNQTSVAQYVRTHPVRGSILFDCGQVTASYVLATPAKPTVHFPHLFILDKSGVIRSHSTGDGNPGEFETKAILPIIEKLLK